MIRLAAVLSVVAAPLWAAPVCDMSGAEPVAVLEAAKEAFFHREFDDFVDAAPAIMTPKNRTVVVNELEKLDKLLPRDFESCQTIVQRRDVAMVQEVIIFNVKGEAFPVSVYLQAIPVRGEMIISYLGFNTTLSETLDDLK